MKKTIAIVGATGKVGSKATEYLLNKGHQLRLVARHAGKLDAFKEKGAEVYAGDSLDADFLTGVFKGSDVLFVMMPVDFTEASVGAYQDKMGIAQIEAIKNSGVKKVLFLSSVGGHTEEHTGIVAGLARQEKRLHELAGVDVLILRPSYFMDNIMGSIGMIKSMNINGSPIEADVSFPIIASWDVAKVAAEKLDAADWTGISVLPLLGPKDYTMAEVTKVLGTAIGKQGLPYVPFPYEQAEQAMQQMGFSESISKAYTGLAEGINTGVFNVEERNAESTTPTTIEEFANTFAAVYNAG